MASETPIQIIVEGPAWWTDVVTGLITVITALSAAGIAGFLAYRLAVRNIEARRVELQTDRYANARRDTLVAVKSAVAVYITTWTAQISVISAQARIDPAITDTEIMGMVVSTSSKFTEAQVALDIQLNQLDEVGLRDLIHQKLNQIGNAVNTIPLSGGDPKVTLAWADEQTKSGPNNRIAAADIAAAINKRLSDPTGVISS